MIHCIYIAIIFLLGMKWSQHLATEYNFYFVVDFLASQGSFTSFIYFYTWNNTYVLFVCYNISVEYRHGLQPTSVYI